jgi:hypothetical protein
VVLNEFEDAAPETISVVAFELTMTAEFAFSVPVLHVTDVIVAFDMTLPVLHATDVIVAFDITLPVLTAVDVIVAFDMMLPVLTAFAVIVAFDMTLPVLTAADVKVPVSTRSPYSIVITPTNSEISSLSARVRASYVPLPGS